MRPFMPVEIIICQDKAEGNNISVRYRMSVSEDRKEYWNRAYTAQPVWKKDGEHWLEAYLDILSSPSYILDMGCGTGDTTEYLISTGHRVIAVDISEVALERLQSRVPDAETMVLDFTKGLPWKWGTFDHVVADLSLHYFDIDTTKRLLDEIAGVLKPGGYLLARVNSVKDADHGFGRGRPVQPNYFAYNGHLKRFFDRESIEEIFRSFEAIRIAENSIETHRGRKHLYEIAGKRLV